MSRRQIFFATTFLYSLLMVFVPSSLIGGLLAVLAAFLVVNAVLGDLLWAERVVFPIYLALLAIGTLLLKYIFNWTMVLNVKTVLLFLVLWLVAYLTILSLNILNVATVRTVPLRKVALSFTYYLGIFLSVPFYFSIFTIFYHNLLLIFLLSFGLSFLFALPNFYFSQIENVVGETFGSEFRVQPKLNLARVAVLGFVIGQITLIPAFWPAKTFIKAVFISGTLFILISFFQNVILKKISQKQIREFLVVWTGLLLMLMVGRE